MKAESYFHFIEVEKIERMRGESQSVQKRRFSIEKETEAIEYLNSLTGEKWGREVWQSVFSGSVDERNLLAEGFTPHNDSPFRDGLFNMPCGGTVKVLKGK